MADHRQELVDGFAARAAYYAGVLDRGLASYDAAAHLAQLRSICILWLDRNLFLWGLPYESLRAGQSPRDIADGPVGKRDFVCLSGMALHSGALALRKHFLDEWRRQGAMPGYAFEWSYVSPIGWTAAEVAERELVPAARAETARLLKARTA